MLTRLFTVYSKPHPFTFYYINFCIEFTTY